MNSLPLPLTREVVLIGGGHAHALLLRAWAMKPVAGARLTVINPASTAPYTGMLPGFVAGHYDRDALEIDLVGLARFANARMIFGLVSGIDRNAKTLTIEGRPPLPYDVASFDIGITSDMPEIPGFSDHAIAAKPLGPFAARWSDHLAGTAGDVVVVGGGIAGVELALAMDHAMQDRGSVTIVEAATALSGVNEASKAHLLEELQTKGITLIENARIEAVQAGSVTLSTGQTLDAKLTVGAAGARPFDWLEHTGLNLTDGFITVDETLRSTNDPNVFAVGDCAHLSHAPRPKAGVFAVRATPVLTKNIQAALSGGKLKPFDPQSHYLKLVSLGPKAALADKWGRAIKGGWVWRWKDRIDQKFMSTLSELPDMSRPALPHQVADGVQDVLGDKPLCAGCGSKVGPDVLDQVLSRIPNATRSDVHVGLGDDAAVLNIGDAKQVITTDHLRAFWNDPWLFARIAALHALGDVWAMGATPQVALSQITLPPLSPALQSQWLSDIMGAAAQVFSDEGAAIAGGHTTQGAELTLGFTVTGLLPNAPIALAGGKPGDRLLLTRPIGSGVLLAAEMQSKAPGNAIESMLTTLATSQSAAASVLRKSAHAMTDVTGFGLAGHTARMAEASGLSAHLSLSGVPIFDGAEALAAQGVRSSVWKANRSISGVSVPDTPRGDLMFDPQTAGGFLAALPADQAEACRDELIGLGQSAFLVGHLEERGEIILRAT